MIESSGNGDITSSDYSNFFSMSNRSGFSRISISSPIDSDSMSLCFESIFCSSVTSGSFPMEISLSESVAEKL